MAIYVIYAICVYSVLSVHGVYSHQDHVLGDLGGEEIWTVDDNQHVVHVYPDQNVYILEFVTQFCLPGSAPDRLELLLTDSYTAFYEVYKFRENYLGMVYVGNVELSLETLLSDTGYTNAKCSEATKNVHTLCTLLKQEADAMCKITLQTAGINITCSLSRWKPVVPWRSVQVWLLVVHRATTRWMRFEFVPIFNYTVPRDTDGGSVNVTASMANVRLLDARGTEKVTGVILRTECSKNQEKLTTSEYKVTYWYQQAGPELLVVMWLKLTLAVPGIYACEWSFLNNNHEVIMSLDTNNIFCCSGYVYADEGYIGYIEFLSSLPHKSNNTRAIVKATDFMKKTTQISKSMETNMDDTLQLSKLFNILARLQTLLPPVCGALIVLAIVYCLYRYSEEYLASRQRERINLLKALKAMDLKRPKLSYDIFVSYSSRDSTFVEGVLLKCLEKRGYKYCFDRRDFHPGISTIQNIVQAIYSSHKTLAVISPSYWRSNWCREMEFALTYRRMLRQGAAVDSLVILQYKTCNMDPVLKSKNYINWCEYGEDKLDLFEQKLAAVLGKPRIQKKI